MPLRFAPASGAASYSLSALTRGPTGATGTAATATAGTTTTANAGTSASVSNSGTTSAATFDFTIPRGADSGIRYSFESSTTMAAPSSGGLRLNNATLSSVTAMAVNATDLDSIDVSDWIVTWDDSTNTTKGTLQVRKEGSGSVVGIFTIGTVTDNTTWLQISLTYVSGSGSLSASDRVYVTPFLTGNKGTDGTVAGPGVSVDSEIALWSGTGGATLKRATGTGIATVTSGVLGVSDTTTTATFGTIELGAAADTTLSRSSAGVLAVEGVTVSLNSTSATHTAGTIELGAATDTTISRSSAGVIAVEGVTVPLNSTSSTYTAGTIELGHATDTTLSRSSAGVLAVEGVTVSLNSTSATHTAGTIELGAATDTTLSRASAGVMAVEGVNLTPNVPITSKSVAYTVVLADANTAIYHPSSDNNARTFTIDSNANVAYPVGTCLTFINEINTVTIAITTDTLTLAGLGSTGSRTLAANGMATAIKVASTKWVISGSGIT